MLTWQAVTQQLLLMLNKRILKEDTEVSVQVGETVRGDQQRTSLGDLGVSPPQAHNTSQVAGVRVLESLSGDQMGRSVTVEIRYRLGYCSS